ncbi:MAG: RHS repeat-associated core domain-containing protein [Cyanobacteria bacterium]|nr:RHS repeat-associated core domain-containing protein [Cyanobacteriota bacterium]
MALHRVAWLLLAATVLLPLGAGAQSGDTVIYYHTDAIGSVRMITDASGAAIARYDFLPFGEAWPPPQTPPDVRQFAGKERDTETKLDYVGARYYQSQTARFTSVDPGHVNGDILDPQSWNGYAYARNNPLKYTDPTGTTYEICAYGSNGMTSSCGSASDQYFAQLERNPGAGLRLWGGAIFSGNKVVGYYNQTSIDATWGTFSASMDRYASAIAPVVNVGAAVTAGIVTGGTAFGLAGGGLAVQPFLFPMGGGMAAAMSAVQNPALRNALNDIFRWQDRIAGGLAGAVRYTQQTGRLVGGTDHLGKVANSIGRLQNILRREALSPSERQLAESVLRDLKGLGR